MALATPALTTLEELAASFRGGLVGPGDDGYDGARRVFNAAVDRRPALVARCTGVADVVAALDYARTNDLPVAVRGGGHSVHGYGTCDGGVVVDTSPMKGLWVDTDRRVARAQAGLTWGELDRETQLFALATTGGRVSETGIAGLILGSGSGWLERKHGLSADNLLSADLVTADGDLLHASEEENPELFWGLRGGGGNFGVVTSFELQLHPVGPVILAGLLLHPVGQAREVLHFFRAYMEQAPDAVMGAAVFLTAPAAPFVPESLAGWPVVALTVGWIGDPEEGELVLEPLRDFGPPAADLVRRMPYVAVQQLFDAGNPPGLRHHWQADNFRALTDEAIEILVDHASAATSPLSAVLLVPLGGAYARVGHDATPLGARDAPWQFQALAAWDDPAGAATHSAWARDLAAALRPYTRPGMFLNYTSEEGEARVASAFGRQKYRRLVALKERYDPDNVFRLNQNISPSGGA
jgi:FAD/FMN-containing dehydrogenase